MSVKDPRLSQILPVIRCSDCGHDVEFRLLGEHICSSAPAMPALPVLPLSKPAPQPPRAPSRTDTPSSGGYKPGYKPPPIPISSSSPTPTAPVSPGRPSTASSRPALPFLEKYAKKNKSGASASPPAPSATPPSQYSNNNITGSPLSVSPTTPTGPSYGQQVSNGMNGHYQREQNDYFPKTPMDDRFGQQASSQYQSQRSKTPVDDPSRRYQTSPAPIPGSGSRSKTPNLDSSSQFSTSPTSSRASQPALPQKSNARSPSIASAHGLGINGLDMNGHKSPSGYDQPEYGRERERDRDRERDYRGNEYDTSPPSIANGFNRSGSSGSAASGIMAERGYQRERSNTAQSERSERSIRSGRSEKERSERSDRSRYPDEDPRRDRDRSDRGDRERERERERDGRGQLTPSSSRSNGRHPDPSSAYKTPSPPISPEDLRPADTLGGKSSPYRPPTPPDMSSPVPSRGRRPSVPAPARKGSGDQFDALMDDLIQEINVLPTSGRDSTRPASAHRSRSRPNIPEFGINGGSSASLRSGSPPPTPGLPKLASGSDSIRSHRSGRERSERSERSERDRGDREHRSERSDRDRERERSDRDRERAAAAAGGERSDRDRERSHRSERERERSTATSRTRSRSTNRRGGVQHCEGCKHDIQPQEVGDVIKMAHGDYHPECFKCARCRRPIESARQGQEYEGRLLCEKDYQRMLEKEAQRNGGQPSSGGRERSERGERSERSRNATCAGCDAPIQKGETPVYALGLSWHEHHLSCYQCKKPIQQSVGHVEKNGRIYCPRDFGELFLPKCRGCGLPVEKEAVCAQDGKLEGKWHAACFGCQTCKKPFPDKSFYVYGDAPYCRRHYHKLNNSLCKSCDQPIEGPCAQTMEGWRFHPGCFSCVECRAPLTDIYYNFENQAYCEKDIMVIQRTRNVRAERRKTFFGKV